MEIRTIKGLSAKYLMLINYYNPWIIGS